MNKQDYLDERKNMAALYTTLMTPDALADWASERTYVGEPNSSYSCPLAHYLDDMTKDLHVKWTVSDGSARWIPGSAGETCAYDLPEWAAVTEALVDDLVCKRITREQFLLILEQAQSPEK